MKVLVYPHDLGMGGSQLNAIEIAAAVNNAGHPTVVFGRPGVLVNRVRELGLEFIEAPEPGRRPSRRVVDALLEVVDERGIDVIHGYEWPPILEAVVAARRRRGLTAVGTVMSMAVAPFIPSSVPLLVGTEQIAALERARGREVVDLLEPPVDLTANDSADVPGLKEFRTRWGVDRSKANIVCVTRLAHQLKLEGLLSAMDAVGQLAEDHSIRLTIVGDGPARSEVSTHADEINARYGADTVILTGELPDPRPAYESADVMIGMGGSALRSMAFAKPLVVQGERGFFSLLTPDTLNDFLWTGWYGVGAAAADGVDRLKLLLRGLIEDSARRGELGAFSRSVVEARFSLTTAGKHQVEFYDRAMRRTGDRVRRLPTDIAAAVRFGDYYIRKRIRRVRGRGASDDFNAQPLVSSATPRRNLEPATGTGTLVYFAGVGWDDVAGTDKHLVTAVSKLRPVLWVDPPTSLLTRLRGFEHIAGLTSVGDNITRLHTVSPPGVTRVGVRTIARMMMQRKVRRALTSQRTAAEIVMASTPDPVLRAWRKSGAALVYYATDDFVAGARLLGVSECYVRRGSLSNAGTADITLAVTDELARKISAGARRADVLPNGCSPDHFEARGLAPTNIVDLKRPIAGLIGQFNDRLDISMLEQVADTGISLLLVGPRRDVDSLARQRFARLILRENVEWLGAKPYDKLPIFASQMDVGLTPYADTPFNRSSFPLKTLEYLSAGLPVVSSDLPSARGMPTRDVALASDPEHFAKLVFERAHRGSSDGEVEARRRYARSQSWDARADQLEQLVSDQR